MRIDKLLSELGFGTRTEIKKDIRAGMVKINGQVIKQADHKVQPESDLITYQDRPVSYTQYEYYLLHKPAGYVSATRDNVYPTVMELIPDTLRQDLFPVGRLDVDTEGLLLITNDGQLAHRLLSPRHHIDKTYYAVIQGIVEESDVQAFSQGLDIGEKKKNGETELTLPASLVLLSTDHPSGTSQVHVTLQEGKFHQVKRMFQAVGKEVTYLKRISMGGLVLDDLPKGQCRSLTDEELAVLKKL